MTDRLNKTSICSVVFLDIIDYSRKSVSEQIDDKTFFNALISEAIKDVAQNDRIIIDTGDGAAITLMGAPEEALFIALTIRDGVLEHNKNTGQSLLVRIGINLGSVRVVKDINDRLNIIGDGINVAQRIMSFTGENEIMVSRSYYEVTSRLTKEMSGMFTYSGIKQDKHIREHEVYLIKPKDFDETKVADSALTDDENEVVASNLAVQIIKKRNWTPFAGATLLVGLSGWLFLSVASEPNISGASEAVNMAEATPLATESKENLANKTLKNNPLKNNQGKTEKVAHKKQVSNDSVPKEKHEKKHVRKVSSKQHSPKAIESKPIQSAQLVIKPIEKNCTQAQIALNQCQ